MIENGEYDGNMACFSVHFPQQNFKQSMNSRAQGDGLFLSGFSPLKKNWKVNEFEMCRVFRAIFQMFSYVFIGRSHSVLMINSTCYPLVN